MIMFIFMLLATMGTGQNSQSHEELHVLLQIVDTSVASSFQNAEGWVGSVKLLFPQPMATLSRLTCVR
jgi:hypothetical protein